MPAPAHAAATTPLRTDVVVDRTSHSIRFQRSFDAPSARIFEAWTRPEHISLWWDPAGQPLASCDIDLRPGGAFRFVAEGRPDMPFTGVYQEIAPPGRLVFEALGATGSVVFEEAGDGTLMTVTIVCRSGEHLDEYLRMGVDAGTSITLDNLVAFIRSGA